jgi:hypothetical protein
MIKNNYVKPNKITFGCWVNKVLDQTLIEKEHHIKVEGYWNLTLES